MERRGFIYLTAVMDWATRRVMACRIEHADGGFRCRGGRRAIARDGRPELYSVQFVTNSD